MNKILVVMTNHRDVINFLPLIKIIKKKYKDSQLYVNLDPDCYTKQEIKEFLNQHKEFKLAKGNNFNIEGNYNIAFLISPYSVNDYYKTLLRLKRNGTKLIYLDYGTTVSSSWKYFRKSFVDLSIFNKLLSLVDYYVADDGDIDFWKTFYPKIYNQNKDKFVILKTSIRLINKGLYKKTKHNGKNILVSLRIPSHRDDKFFHGKAYDVMPRMLTYAMDNPDVNVYFRLHNTQGPGTSFHLQAEFFSKRYKNIFYDDTEYHLNVLDKYKIFKKMDLIISDYSSILYEYTTYDTPIICVDKEHENEYFDNVRLSMFFVNPEELIDNLDGDPKEHVRKLIIKDRFIDVKDDIKKIESII